MRYGGFWQDTTTFIRLAGFGTVLLVVVLVGLGIRHLRHRTPAVHGFSQVFTSVKQDLGENMKDYEVVENKWLALPEDNNPQHVKGYQYTVASSAQPDVVITAHTSYASGHSLDAVTAAVEQTLQKHGFKKSTPNPLLPVSHDASQTIYQQGNDQCTVTAYTEHSQVFLQCTNQTEIKQRAAEAQSFIDTYLAHHLDVRPQDIIFGQLKIRYHGSTVQSKATSYDVAEAVIYRPGAAQGKLALFSGRDGRWNYVTETDLTAPAFSCTDIEADADASKAFIGLSCLDDIAHRTRKSGVVN